MDSHPDRPVPRTLAHGAGWAVSHVDCRLGPHDRPFEERHDRVSLAAVLSGTFTYHSFAGRSLLYPGAVMLGNAGTCYECGHEHGAGDECLALQFDRDYFEEVAAGVAGSARFRFAIGMLPAVRELAGPITRAHGAAVRGDAVAAEEAALTVAEAALTSLAGPGAKTSLPRGSQRRLSAALRYIEAHSHERLDLGRIAQVACMSKYHFVRTFRRSLGLTPYQFLLGHRLRRAAAALRAAAAPVAEVAYREGFGDLSEFHAQFRRVFGTSPARFRAA